ncbi:MAG: FAD:protein FMN transferase [Firmicutes bacterium]|nr:FAD:protein FMN transferase [Bacillota bacterium]HOB35485.1 FAD:protein FMN transferase [Bacillota bacterium]HPZ90467.1 FAD:protein FMN transferase [Bacillota bacterium]HQE02343.1 FAD:protein FMN transferase [Bacillota bacterium]
MRKLIAAMLLALLCLTAAACSNTQPKLKFQLYSDSILDAFDTVITLFAYTETEEEFREYFELARTRFRELHRYYDIYNTYPGLNNIKTINDMAGIAPVKVDKEVLDLVALGVDWARAGRKTNIALGPVLQIWHDYRTDGVYDPDNAALPPMELLQEAARRADIDKVIIDVENSTVFLAEPGMRLDVGAVAKGYATEVVARELYAAGMRSGAISAGGNIRTVGKPRDGVREQWGIGIIDPAKSLFAEDRNLDMVFVNDASVVTSGDYQRYYYVDGVRYHHLIDPDTLMPAPHFRAVTVVTRDSGLADLLSTELFLLPYAESRQLADALDGVEALWVMPDGEVRITDGLKKMLRSHGADGKEE